MLLVLSHSCKLAPRSSEDLRLGAEFYQELPGDLDPVQEVLVLNCSLLLVL